MTTDKDIDMVIDFTTMSDEGLLAYIEASTRILRQMEAASEARKIHVSAATYEAMRRRLLVVGFSD